MNPLRQSRPVAPPLFENPKPTLALADCPAPLDVADVEQAFFDSAPPPEPLHFDPPEAPAPISPEVLQMRERARARRVRFARYVRVIVAGAAALFAIGVVRTTVFGSNGAFAAPTPVHARLAAPRPDPSPPTLSPAPTPAPAPSPVTPTPASTLDPLAAKTERLAAQRALDRRDPAAALAAAESATQHEPTEAKGWLLLGAAHLERGDARAARAAFRDCVTRAKTGPRHECAALLR